MEQESLTRLRNFVVILALLLLIGFVGLFTYKSVVFRVTGTDPPLGGVATISPYFRVNFNKQLFKGVVASIYPANFPIHYSIDGSSITINFDKQLQEGQTYRIHLSHIVSVVGKKMPDKMFVFEAKNLGSTQLSIDQQATLNQKQKQYNTIKGDGLLQLLPFTGGGNEFQISYTVDYSGQSPRVILIVATSGQQGQNDALAWIREVGFDPSKYIITYTDLPPQPAE